MPIDDGLNGRRPEVEVIVRGARRILGDADVGVLEGLLDDELDWKWIVEAAERHGTAALVRAVLAERFADRVPPWVLIQLEAATHVQALRNEVLAQSLGQLASAFHDQGIRVLAFKGPVLAMSVYHDLGLRAFGDLDLLVDRRDYQEAGRLLVRLGYERRQSWPWEASFQGDLTVVDLHRALTSPRFRFRLPFETLWSRRQTVLIGGTAVPGLSNEHLLIVLCVQIAKDAWEDRLRLAKVCDVAELVRVATDLDWDAALREAERAGGLGIVAFGLTTAARLLDAPVPDRVLRRLDRFEDAIALAATAVADPLRTRRSRPSSAAMLRFHAQLRERKRDRLYSYVYVGHYLHRVARTFVPTEYDRAVVSLPAALDPMYFVVRPIRLLAKAVRAIGRRARQ